MKRIAPLMVLLALGCALALPARADRLGEIRHRGAVVVGVKKDVPLWGYQDPRTGQLTGLEPDLAADLARRLGVKLQLVGLTSSELDQAVESGRVDVLIANLTDTAQRREHMAMVLPHYYASGSNILARQQKRFKSWDDLRNRRVCGRRGAFYNRAVTVSFAIDIVALYSNNLALAALRDGRCDALIYDDTRIIGLLSDPDWSRDFEMPLPTLFVTPWAIAVTRSEEGGALQAQLSRMVVDWHRGGSLLALERKWGIPASAYALKMNTQWLRRAGGGWACGDTVTPATPKECL